MTSIWAIKRSLGRSWRAFPFCNQKSRTFFFQGSRDSQGLTIQGGWWTKRCCCLNFPNRKHRFAKEALAILCWTIIVVCPTTFWNSRIFGAMSNASNIEMFCFTEIVCVQFLDHCHFAISFRTFQYGYNVYTITIHNFPMNSRVQSCVLCKIKVLTQRFAFRSLRHLSASQQRFGLCIILLTWLACQREDDMRWLEEQLGHAAPLSFIYSFWTFPSRIVERPSEGIPFPQKGFSGKKSIGPSPAGGWKFMKFTRIESVFSWQSNGNQWLIVP